MKEFAIKESILSSAVLNEGAVFLRTGFEFLISSFRSWRILFVAVFLFWFLGLLGVVGGSGWLQAKRLESSRDRLVTKVELLTHEKEVLQSRLNAMKSDVLAQESLVRQELTFGRPEETVFEFPALDTP